MQPANEFFRVDQASPLQSQLQLELRKVVYVHAAVLI